MNNGDRIKEETAQAIIHQQRFQFLDNLNFSKALEALNRGHIVRRAIFTPDVFVVKQIPAEIPKDVVPKMQSLPYDAKKYLLDHNLPLSYENQLLIIRRGVATYYSIPTEDLFAEDWEIIVQEP